MSHRIRRYRAVIPGLLMVLVVVPAAIWLYWPGIASPLMLDDYSSVVPVSLQAASDESWTEFVFGDRAGPLGRPVSMATFVIEQRVFGITLEEAKTTNIILHGLNGILVFCLIRILFASTDSARAGWFALLAAGLWLVAPIHVSTVLYLVQRMAMLSAFFVLLAMVLYALGRQMSLRGMQGWWLPCIFSPVSVVVGMLSKENAVVGFPIILMLEFMVFRFQGFPPAVASRARVLCMVLTGIGACVALLLLVFNWAILEKSYALRPFSLMERLLTQLRVLWDYVGQTVLPDVSRMAIHHDDFPLSESLLQPLPTLYAALGWCLVVTGIVLLLVRKRGLLFSFGVLFFLLTQALESSIIPLELYYEHRNYLPSVGTFLSLAALAAWLIRRIDGAATPVGIVALVYLGFLFFSTSSQVKVWSSPSLLAINTVDSHPDSPRANVDMSVHLARNGAYRLARDYSKKAHELAVDERWLDYQFRNIILACYANESGAAISREDIPHEERLRPIADVHTLSILIETVVENHCSGLDAGAMADVLAEIFIEDAASTSASALVYSRLAALENTLERYEKAYWYAERYLELSPNSVTAMLMLLHFSAILDRPEQVAALRSHLWQLQGQGKLSQSEENTLKLYNPVDPAYE